MENDPIRGIVHIHSEVRSGENWDNQRVVELKFTYHDNDKKESHIPVVVDRATAARLINQLRKVLDA